MYVNCGGWRHNALHSCKKSVVKTIICKLFEFDFELCNVFLGVGHCNPLSAVCRIVQSTGFDLGYFSSATLRNGSGEASLVLTYKYKQSVNGASCPLVTTEIQFVCNHSVSIGVSGYVALYNVFIPLFF